jgi:DNA-binding NarL/FixJ family response regulator
VAIISGDQHGEDVLITLTAREREILALIASGSSNREIARALTISERTARTHASHVLKKLGVASRVQAALWAVRHGAACP